MKKLILTLCLGLSLSLSAQRWAMHPLVFVGYDYNQYNFLSVGGRLLFLRNDDALFRIGASAMVGIGNGQVRLLPQVQGDLLLNFQKERSVAHGHYWLLGLSATTHQMTPKVGVNILGVLEATAGYSFGQRDFLGKDLSGPHIGLVLNVPTVVFKG